MTQVAIQAQVDSIRKATENASKSKESATKFLVDAGIITKGGNTNKKVHKPKDKK